MRTQFPLRLAYAMTFNKSQGQQFLRLLVDTTRDTFEHGHLYVALSRAIVAANVACYLHGVDIIDDMPIVQSICYRELLIDA